MKYSKVTFGHAEAVFNKLGGEEGIQDFLSGRTRVVKSEHHFRTLFMLGVGAYDIRKMVEMIKKDKTIKKKSESQSILDWPPLGSSEVKTVELVIVRPIDLGFEHMFESCATYENICSRAESYGLDQCPQEVGMLLCLSHNRQNNNEFYVVASKPLRNKEGKEYLIVPWYTQKEECEIDVFEVIPKNPFFIEYSFLFCRRNIKI